MWNVDDSVVMHVLVTTVDREQALFVDHILNLTPGACSS